MSFFFDSLNSDVSFFWYCIQLPRIDRKSVITVVWFHKQLQQFSVQLLISAVINTEDKVGGKLIITLRGVKLNSLSSEECEIGFWSTKLYTHCQKTVKSHISSYLSLVHFKTFNKTIQTSIWYYISQTN